jgi:hypothetical protein
MRQHCCEHLVLKFGSAANEGDLFLTLDGFDPVNSVGCINELGACKSAFQPSDQGMGEDACTDKANCAIAASFKCGDTRSASYSWV